MICGCRRVRMYSTSLWTRVLVLVIWMTALDMYFIATFWPVMVWVATAEHALVDQGQRSNKIVRCTFDFAKGPLGDILYDCVFTQLCGRVHCLFAHGGEPFVDE